MSVQLSSFINSFSNDLARPSKFDVVIIPQLANVDTSMLRQLTLRCETAELPSRTFGTVDQKFGSNPTLKFPVHSSYNDLTLNFIVSGDMSEKIFFDQWMESINPTLTFDFNYKENYQATIYVNQYDMASNTTYQCILYNAYPIVVNQLDLDWSTDSFHKLSVVFAYDYWQNSVVKKGYDTATIPLSSQNIPDPNTVTKDFFKATTNVMGAVPGKTNYATASQQYQQAYESLPQIGPNLTDTIGGP